VPSGRYDGEVRYIEDYNYSGVKGVEFLVSDKQTGEDLLDGNIAGIPDVGNRLPLVDGANFEPGTNANSNIFIDSPDETIYLSPGDIFEGLQSISGEIQRISKNEIKATGQAGINILRNNTVINYTGEFILELRIENFYSH